MITQSEVNEVIDFAASCLTDREIILTPEGIMQELERLHDANRANPSSHCQHKADVDAAAITEIADHQPAFFTY